MDRRDRERRQAMTALRNEIEETIAPFDHARAMSLLHTTRAYIDWLIEMEQTGGTN